jgi:peptidyl-prolyl cis-trans isomerase D
MLANIRQFAKSWPARILLIILAISFVGWGVNQGGTSMISGDQVIKAGSRTVTSLEFRKEFDTYKKRIEEESGQQITNELAEENNLDATVLNGVATREAFSEILSKMGIKPGDKLIVDQISQIQAFFDPITGKFDKATFQRRLADNGMTPEMFDAGIRDQMATQHWAVGVQNGLAAPRTYGALAAIYALESRDLAYVTLLPGSVPAPPAPTDAQLQAVINENKERLTVPETRTMTIVLFTPGGVQAATAPIDPAELQKRYQFRKDTLSTPETRSLVQIPVKDQAGAQQAIARLGRGEAPAAVAKSLGVDALVYDAKPLTAVSDRKVGQAAFRMPQGQAAAVQGDLGLSVVRVTAINPGREVSLEEARPMLEAEIRKDMVAEKVYAQTQAFDDAHQSGASLADAAKKAGVASTSLGPITAQGVDGQGRQLQGLPPKILETAFALPSGGESDITDLGDGAYFALKVEQVTPPRVRPLAEVRDQVVQYWTQREIVRALEAKANGLTERVRKGESFDTVAASAGPVSRLPGLTRQSAGQHEAQVGREVLGKALSARPGEVWTAGSPQGIVVGRVDNVRAEGGPTAARMAEMSRGQLTQVLFREMAESAQVYARNKLKVKVDRDRARVALGFEPLTPADKAGVGKAGAEKKK